MDYNGYIRLEEEDAAKFYQTKQVDGVLENEYVFIGDDVYCYQDGTFRRVLFPVIKNEFSGTIKPRNIEQVAALDMLQDSSTTVKLITGTWGTGKTMFLSAAAIDAINNNLFDKIVWIRNNVQVKDTDNMGALPGDKDSKILPYVMPLADHCGGVIGLNNFIEQGVIETDALAYIRGRSIRNSIIMCSEAENLTKEQIQLIIARADDGSQVWFDADIKQRDRIVFEKSRGVETMIDRLKGNELFGYVHLVKSERSATASLANLLDD